MNDPVVAVTAFVAAATSLPLVPVVLRGVVRLVRRILRAATRPRPAAALVLVGVLGRPAAAEAVTEPPILRMPAPPPYGEGGAPPAAVEPDLPGARYVVAAGDSLWAISARYLQARTGVEPSDAAVDRAWRRVYAANVDVVGIDPDLIYPGQLLTIPEEL